MRSHLSGLLALCALLLPACAGNGPAYDQQFCTTPLIDRRGDVKCAGSWVIGPTARQRALFDARVKSKGE